MCLLCTLCVCSIESKRRSAWSKRRSVVSTCSAIVCAAWSKRRSVVSTCSAIICAAWSKRRFVVSTYSAIIWGSLSSSSVSSIRRRSSRHSGCSTSIRLKSPMVLIVVMAAPPPHLILHHRQLGDLRNSPGEHPREAWRSQLIQEMRLPLDGHWRGGMGWMASLTMSLPPARPIL